MSLTAKQGSSFEPVEAGNHHGVCVAVIDLGTQHSEKYKKDQPKVCILWELPEVFWLDEEGNPDMKRGCRDIHKPYTASLNEKAHLYLDLVSWRGRDFTEEELEGFNIKNVLGANCLVNIVHSTNQKGRTYANVSTVAKLPKGISPKKASYQLIYDMDEGMAIPDGVPDFIKKIIWQSTEYRGLDGRQSIQQESPPDDSDIPF